MSTTERTTGRGGIVKSARSGCAQGLKYCLGSSLVMLGIAAVVSIVVLIMFFKTLDFGERLFIAPVGHAISAFTGYAWAFSTFVKELWVPSEAVHTVVLRDAVATTSAAGNAVTYFASEIGSLRPSLATVGGALFAPIAVPTAEVANVERGIEKLQKNLEEYIPKELARLYSIKRAMEHITDDFVPENSQASQGGTGQAQSSSLVVRRRRSIARW